jgi:hypothetical protein
LTRQSARQLLSCNEAAAEVQLDAGFLAGPLMPDELPASGGP